jgi:protoheme IX farnesyltransferase
MLKAYYNLTKPGIIYGNLVNTISGFLLACVLQNAFSVAKGLGVLVGTALVIACGCVVNNYIDRDIDRQMQRTKNRALVRGDISGRSALIFAAVLGTLGFIVLWRWTNAPTLLIGIVGLVDYIVAYGYFKRHSPVGTLVGSISGATPPLAGYVVMTGGIDLGAILVFLLFAVWQMPHFYAIALYRSQEYKAAGIPVLPLKKGRHYTKVAIVAYIALFIVCNILLSVFGYTGYVFAIAMSLFGALWLYKGLCGFKTTNIEASDTWARSMFGFSLIVVIALAVLLPAGALLP